MGKNKKAPKSERDKKQHTKEQKRKVKKLLKETMKSLPLNQIICGDCLEVLEDIPNESIDLVITSPPYYKQRDYGKGIGNENRLEEYIENLYEVFHECVRVVRNDGSIVFNIGDKYENGGLLLAPYRFALTVLERESVELVNDITWMKRNPTPRQFKRRLISSTEPFFHFAKSEDYYYNIDAFLKESKTKKRKEGSNAIGKGYFELIEKSFLSEEQKKMAREELEKVIQEVKIGEIESFRMKIKGIHSPPFGNQEGGRKYHLMKKGFTIIRLYGEPAKRDVIEYHVETIKGCRHPAIYPEYIIQELLKLLTKKGDVVLDPFIGSGTTAVACKKLGRNYIGIEINPDYCKYAEERINSANFQLPLELYETNERA
jgi:site-specific DNA-methyltransferase (adenine-specific)